MIGYGLLSKIDAHRIATKVCDILGHGGNRTAVKMLLETAQAETQLGAYIDRTPNSAGVGLCQFDRIAFDDVKNRTRKATKKLIFRHLGIDIDSIEHIQLAYSPMLSLIFCRLFYRLIPGEIPVDILGRAAYWKKYYNTKAGKGKVDHYIQSAMQIRLNY